MKVIVILFTPSSDLNHNEEHYRSTIIVQMNKTLTTVNKEEDELTEGCDTDDESNVDDDSIEVFVVLEALLISFGPLDLVIM